MGGVLRVVIIVQGELELTDCLDSFRLSEIPSPPTFPRSLSFRRFCLLALFASVACLRRRRRRSRQHTRNK
jgi:hypothetical protein